MTWKIDRSQIVEGMRSGSLVFKSAAEPFFLTMQWDRGALDLHVLVGHADPSKCPIDLCVKGPTHVVVMQMDRWTAVELKALFSILASLEVAETERRRVLGWTAEHMRSNEPDEHGYWHAARRRAGAKENETFSTAGLTDEQLLAKLNDRRLMHIRRRREFFVLEAKKRGLVPWEPIDCNCYYDGGWYVSPDDESCLMHPDRRGKTE